MSIAIPATGIIGQTITGLTNIAGSTFLALLMILIIFTVIALALSIPMEGIAIILMPMLIVFTAYTGDFLATAGCVLIYMGFILADKLFPHG